ncbi:TrmH family RNA methyltransferase [Microbulbifer bruguierae]|uniref:TrmH family RNA methyltransferase n=1 Tax=Microbulbifer bruguierae TaxID=3029061 RepID=A0ABY8NFK2_9GAMM|nr:TrmH family RNA methyltransferase [Microbulbifer bruguierae]WGL16852.1 TrmH family RNA methyltransferase [Microbulbifer bruguierae]
MNIKEEKSNLRKRADKVKGLRCKNLIVVLENPMNIMNIGSAIRNANALGAEKIYVVDSRKVLPESWEQMRDRRSLLKVSASAIKWSFVKTFPSTESCLAYLEKHKFVSVVTSPHTKGQRNVVLHQGRYTHKRLAVWFGSEAQGISDLAVENSDFCINIPMCGIIESMNLGTTTGVVLYEVTRQRREFVSRRKSAG